VFESESLSENKKLFESRNLNFTTSVMHRYYINRVRLDVPESYVEFHRKHFHNLCTQCKSYTFKKQMICLLCNQSVCIGRCSNKSEGGFGNVSDHTIQYHKGAAYYVQL
jgi:hypothetical protein